MRLCTHVILAILIGGLPLLLLQAPLARCAKEDPARRSAVSSVNVAETSSATATVPAPERSCCGQCSCASERSEPLVAGSCCEARAPQTSHEPAPASASTLGTRLVESSQALILSTSAVLDPSDPEPATLAALRACLSTTAGRAVDGRTRLELLCTSLT